ncbi:MAG: HPr family phosphocarrier protein [Chlamydiia bacterium]|nr:HPr family phosphocarrier protein [Chlamydiia bacterium]MCP5510106.1 HPr family phosphocarrier protein [Chlamydiales bacterium]HPE84998.1 HPr family phosphocarrier protein [Chlamydiales bacterium]
MKLQREVKVKNPLGLHARPAAYIARLLQDKRSQVHFTYRGEKVNARSIMGVLILAAQKNARIQIDVDGEDAETTMQALIEAFESEFEDGNA